MQMHSQPREKASKKGEQKQRERKIQIHSQPTEQASKKGEQKLREKDAKSLTAYRTDIRKG